MKTIIKTISIFAACGSIAFGSVSISGTAVNNLTAADVSNTGIVYVDTLGTGFGSLTGSVTGIDSSFVDVYTGEVTGGLFGNAFSIDPPAEFNLGGDLNSGDLFGVLIFDTPTTYSVYTNPGWIVPADSGSLFLTGGDTADGATPLGTGTIVPEPSTFGLLAGCFGLAWVMARRRK